MLLNDKEIIVQANPVKYHDIEYHDDYIVVSQHRTRRRVPNGFYFEDTGSHIYVSTYYSSMFQCKYKIRRFVVNTETKEWRDYQSVIIEKHKPEKKDVLDNNTIERLKK